MSEVTTVFGIDLGTTYSCISYLKDGHPVVCQNIEGNNTTPSVVRMPYQGEGVVVGDSAKDTAIMYPQATIQFVKSKIGRVENFEYGDEGEKISITPEEVSAEILRKLAGDAQLYTGMTVHDVVITVPAYFGNNEKQATLNAGIKAGLNVIDIVEEPTAAAFYYGCEKSENDEVICIFDLGGGTFDVTAMQNTEKKLSVITTDGDHDLGGKNWDAELIDLAEEKFREATGYQEEFDSDIRQELILKCETAKRQLTNADSASFNINIDRNNRALIKITREEFEDRTSSLMESAVSLTRDVFNRVEERGFKVDKILLVGGSTFMPQVTDAIKKEFGITPELNEPNEAVSKGACLYCAWKLLHQSVGETAGLGSAQADENEEEHRTATEINNISKNDDGTTVVTLMGANGDTRDVQITLPEAIVNKVIVTVATKSFGIKAVENGKLIIANMITKDAELPVTVNKTFGTNTDNMKNIMIELYQSEREESTMDFIDPDTSLESGVKIGDAILDGLPDNLPAKSPVELTIKLTENGIIEITGTHNGLPLNGSLSMSYAEGIAQKEKGQI